MALVIPIRKHRQQPESKVASDQLASSPSPVSDPVGADDDASRSIPIELLSVKQTAAYLGVAEITIRRWIATGILPSLRAGRQIRIDKAELVKFLHLQPDHEGS